MAVTDTGWPVAWAAIGAAGFTGVAAFGVEWWRSHLKKSSGQTADLTTACVELIASAHMLCRRAATMRANMFMRSGLTESLNVITRLRRPPDMIEISDYLYQDLESAQRAQARIWLVGNVELIEAAGMVVASMANVVEASAATPHDFSIHESDPITRKLFVLLARLRPMRKDASLEQARLDSVKVLARTCARLGEVMRRNLKVSQANAIVLAHPGLNVEGELSS